MDIQHKYRKYKSKYLNYKTKPNMFGGVQNIAGIPKSEGTTIKTPTGDIKIIKVTYEIVLPTGKQVTVSEKDFISYLDQIANIEALQKTAQPLAPKSSQQFAPEPEPKYSIGQHLKTPSGMEFVVSDRLYDKANNQWIYISKNPELAFVPERSLEPYAPNSSQLFAQESKTRAIPEPKYMEGQTVATHDNLVQFTIAQKEYIPTKGQWLYTSTGPYPIIKYEDDIYNPDYSFRVPKGQPWPKMSKDISPDPNASVRF